MTVFIDESGILGINKDRYFVIALISPQNPNRIKNIIKSYCAKKDIPEIKASILDTPEKQIIFNKLCSVNDYSISYIVLDKTKIQNQVLFSDKNLTFNYIFSFLIKKTIRGANSNLDIYLDNRTTKVSSVNSLSDYIKISAVTKWNYKHTLSISYKDSKECKAIQMADLVANAIYAKYNYGANHFYEMLTISESIKFPYETFGK